MEIASAQQSFKNVTYGEDSFNELLNQLASPSAASPYHLSLLVGTEGEAKGHVVKEIADATERNIYSLDANDIITKVESESFENLDYVFSKYEANHALFYLKNGSRLCGVYTGYTQSRVKYATPQERYFLKKVQQTGGIFVVDMNTSTDADTTVQRAAQSIINLPAPRSGLKRLLQKLRGVSVHGHQIKTERPERYGKPAGNF